MLGIRVGKVCDFIVKAREFDAKVEVVEPDPGSNMAGEDFREVLESYSLESYSNDPVYEELSEFLEALNEDERINLVALAWLGRGDFTANEWEEALAEARRNRGRPLAPYLLGMPTISDYLEEGLSQLGYSCED